MKNGILVFLLVAALGLRFCSLGRHSYRGTEVGTISAASGSFVQTVEAGRCGRSPLFSMVLLHGWIKIFPGTEFATRGLSALFGALSVIPLFFLARRLTGRKTALMAACLVAISPFHILLSRTVQDFGLSLFLATASLTLFLYWCEENKGFPWYVATTILMLYSGPFLFLILIGEWLYFFVRWRTTKGMWKIWLIGQLLIVAAYSYWIWDIFKIFPGEWQTFDRLPTTLGVAGKAVYAFYAFSLGETVLPWKWWVVCPATIVFAGTSLFSLTRIKRNYRILPFVTIFLLIPMAPIFTNRGAPEYLIAASIAYYVLLAMGIKAMKAPISWILLGLIILFNGYSLFNLYTDKQYHTQGLTDDWRLISTYTEKESVVRQMPVVAYHGSFVHYYKGGNLITFDPRDPEDTQAKLANMDRILFVDTPGSGVFSSNDDRIHQFKKWLDQNFLCVQSVGFFENEEYETKRKFIKRSFPRFRVQVLVYERED
jgi:hypothetical protein